MKSKIIILFFTLLASVGFSANQTEVSQSRVMLESGVWKNKLGGVSC